MTNLLFRSNVNFDAKLAEIDRKIRICNNKWAGGVLNIWRRGLEGGHCIWRDGFGQRSTLWHGHGQVDSLSAVPVISRVLWICKCDLQWLVSTVVCVGPAPLWIRIISEKKGFRSSGIWANIAPNSSGFGTENFVKQYRQLVPHLFRFYSF